MENSDITHEREFWARQAKFWLAFLVIFILVLWLFSPVILPFVLGTVIAYLLNPAVQGLGKYKISRTFATTLILGGFLLVLVLTLSVVVPVLSAELLKFLRELPAYINQIWEMTEPWRSALKERIGQEEMQQIRTNLENSSGKLLSLTENFLSGVVNSGQAIISFISVLVLMPIVAFYMMIEWPNITKWLDKHTPEEHRDTTRRLSREIDTKLSGFIRGQLIVAFILGLIYAAAMKLAGLNYGLLIGLGAGILSIIPMVGSAVGLLTGIIVAWFQTFEPGFTIMIAGIFIAGQLFEGNFLTPKLVGDRVGLHPLWILFALMAGGALYGFVGVLIAVPVAAVISVFVKFSLDLYKQSVYYSPSRQTTDKPEDNKSDKDIDKN